MFRIQNVLPERSFRGDVLIMSNLTSKKYDLLDLKANFADS